MQSICCKGFNLPCHSFHLIACGTNVLGRAIAENLANEKVNVVISDINQNQAISTAKEIQEKYGVKTLAVEHDVSSEESTKALVKQAITEFNRIDILVNNAGITRDARLMMMKKSDWELVMNINLTGAFFCTKYASKQMIKQRSGKIINIASVVGLMGNIGQANYSASKAGLIGLTKTSAKELAERGITVNAVAPGYIHSDMTEQVSAEATNRMLEIIPMKTYGNPADVAGAVVFLASQQARYITGQVLNIDGGMVM